MCVYINICVCVYIHMCIKREREREVWTRQNVSTKEIMSFFSNVLIWYHNCSYYKLALCL